MKNLVLNWTVNTYIFGSTVISNLIVESSQLRYLDKVAETLLCHNVIGHIELVIRCLFGEDCRPRIEAPDVLPFKLIRTKILEQQIQFRQTVGYGCATEKSSSQILAGPLLNGSDCIQQVECPLASFRVA